MAENPEEAAKQEAEYEEMLARLRRMTAELGLVRSAERERRVEALKAAAARCAECEAPFTAGTVVFWRREYDEITSPVLPYCSSCRCRQSDGYHNRDAPPGLCYPACRCEDRYWTTPEPCLGCGRPVSYPENAAWRRVRGWPFWGEETPAEPRVFCSGDCKRTVLAIEARSARLAAAAERDPAVCQVCRRAFEPKRRGARYCSPACRQRAFRARRAELVSAVAEWTAS